jgi:hypothetical protein
MRKLLQSFGYAVLVTIGLIVVLLLFSSLMIATDLTKQELIDEYANETSFFYFLPSGAEVHIRDQGDKNKPPLILMHGANGSLHNWEKLVAELKNDWSAIRRAVASPCAMPSCIRARLMRWCWLPQAACNATKMTVRAVPMRSPAPASASACCAISRRNSCLRAR